MSFGWPGTGRPSPRTPGGLLRGYATLAAWLYGVVLVTGTLAAITLVPSVHALTSTPYGRVLVGKLGLVLLVSLLALLGKRRLRSAWGADQASGSLPRSARLERGALVLVLGPVRRGPGPIRRLKSATPAERAGARVGVVDRLVQGGGPGQRPRAEPGWVVRT